MTVDLLHESGMESVVSFGINRYQTRIPLLNWEHSFVIVKGIVEGLCYLHNFTCPPILHCDLKPSYMLLGRDMIPKISDVRLVQMMETGTTEAAMGTAGLHV
ncbi:receptor-like serine/threonine kinase 2 [Raphanus sativus]|nr:receptor-like serine/threonine kinase 2 [Raphanus sativus]